MATEMHWTCASSLSPPEIRNNNCSQKSPDDFHVLRSPQKSMCDAINCFAIKQIKKYLTMEVILAIVQHKEELLTMGFSSEFIELLLSFGKGKIVSLNNNSHGELTFQHPEVKVEHDQNVSSVKDGCGSGNNVTVKNLTELTEGEEIQLASQCKQSRNGNLSILECKLCGYQSKSNKLMIRHLGCHDNGKCFTCSNCGYTTPFRSKWNKHTCRMSDKRNLSCNNCPDAFQTKVALDHHVATQHADAKTPAAKVFVCDKCPYVGRNLSSLVDHQRKHTGEYLKCSKPGCSFQTPYKRSLSKHMVQKHSTEKPKICLICGIQTKHALSLSEHMRRHEKTSKCHKCSQCSFASHSSTDVALHVRRKHLKEKKYACSKCPFETGYPTVLKNHLARHEADTVQPKRKVKKNNEHCSFCNKDFKTRSEKTKHEKNCVSVRMPVPDVTTPTTVSTNGMEEINPKVCDDEVFNGQEMYNFDSQLDMDISDEVFKITSSILNQDDTTEDRNTFTAIVDDSIGASALTQDGYHGPVGGDPLTGCKGRNPMLAETTPRDDSPLLGESLLSLMSDFPRPLQTNRCQSATTLMFTSLSPHLVDRPLTPDFLSENPSSSFFL